MDVTIRPISISGTVRAPASKSIAQRLLILSAIANTPTFLAIEHASDDIAATVRCLRALGARIQPMERRDSSGTSTRGLRVTPLPHDPSGRPVALSDVALNCNESGATLRFLIPVVCALPARARFSGEGRLPERPLAPLTDELLRHGATIEHKSAKELPLVAEGPVRGGRYSIDGSVSSQYISGLLLASPLLDEGLDLHVLDPFESKPYVRLTAEALERFGVHVLSDRLDGEHGDSQAIRGAHFEHATRFIVEGRQRLVSPGDIEIEGDWSQAAFWLAAGAIGEDVRVSNLNLSSVQGDRAILGALALMGVRVSREGGICQATGKGLRGAAFDLSDMPDLVCPLAAVAALAEGKTRFFGTRRLRLKESDRLESVRNALTALGGKATLLGDELEIEGVCELSGGVVDAAKDHRIAMMAAVCALRAKGPVTILGAECVSKSYPTFFEELRALGGSVEEA